MVPQPVLNQAPPARPLIKICGLTQPENALACARAGADAIGLVFFSKSPRHVTLPRACKITTALPGHILTCGVFVDESYDRIMAVVRECGLKAVQLHGSEPPALAEQIAAQGLKVIKAFFASRPPYLASAPGYPAHFCLVEYGKGILPGGNAETWDYEAVSGQARTLPLMLAGGLGPENIQHAVARVRPRGVDVSSGVESSPGIKDMDKVSAFIRAARA